MLNESILYNSRMPQNGYYGDPSTKTASHFESKYINNLTFLYKIGTKTIPHTLGWTLLVTVHPNLSVGGYHPFNGLKVAPGWLIDDEDAVVRAKVRIAYSILHMARPAGGPPLRYPPWQTDDDESMIYSHSPKASRPTGHAAISISLAVPPFRPFHFPFSTANCLMTDCSQENALTSDRNRNRIVHSDFKSAQASDSLGEYLQSYEASLTFHILLLVCGKRLIYF